MSRLVLPDNVHVVNHPVLAALAMRTRRCTEYGPVYQHCVERMGAILAVEATRHHAQVVDDLVDMGDLGVYEGVCFAGRPALMPIMRAGLGLLRPFQEILPHSCSWDINIRRDEENAEAQLLECKVPKAVPDDVSQVYVLDPMLATGGSAAMAIECVKAIPSNHPIEIIFVGVLGCQKGYEKVLEHHPDVQLYLAELAPGLDRRFFLLKGYGDIGNNIWGAIT